MKPAARNRETLKLDLAAEVLRSSGELRFIARGASMIPSIFPGDILLVHRQSIGEAGRGEVALWSRDGRFYAHRVIRTANSDGESVIVTRGDALNRDDPPVGGAEFLGRVLAVERRGKQMELAASQSTGAQLLRWLARHSDGATKWILRYHSLRRWFAGSSALIPANSGSGLRERL
jgi:signal peptidase I